MSDIDHTSAASPNDPAPDATPADRAAERIGHALLEFTRSDNQLAQERRIAAVMAAVRGGTAVTPQRGPAVVARFKVALGALGGIAAMIAVMTAVVVMTPGQQTAQAVIERAITAAQDAGIRRYEIRIQGANADEPGEPIGTLDVDGAGRILFKIKRPARPGVPLAGDDANTAYTIAGRDAEGEWAIRPDGGIERDNPDRAWPEWSRIAGDTVLVAAVDDMMLALQRRFTLSKGDNATRGQLHIRAVPARPGPLPDSVDVWIDDATNLVEKLEARWSRAERDLPDRPRTDQTFDGPPPRRPPPGPDGPRDGPRDGIRPDGPRMDGPRPDGPRPDGPRMDGPPREAQRRRPPPPRLIIFERVKTPDLPEDWFTPAAHTNPE